MRRALIALLAAGFLAAAATGQENSNPLIIKLLSPATAVVLAPQAKFAAVASADRTLSVWDLSTAQNIKKLPLESEQLDTIAISPDGRLVFACQHDGSAAVWDVSTGKKMRQWQLSHYANASAFSRDGRLLAFSPGGQPTQVFAVNGFEKRGETAPVPGGVQSFAFSRDGSLLATADSDAGVRVYSTNDMKLLSENHDLLMEPLGVDFTADGKEVAAAGGDRTVMFVDTASGKLIRRLAKTENPIFFNGLRVSANGAHIGLVFMKAENMSEPAPIAIWSIASGEKLSERTLPALISGAEWTADGKLLCVGGEKDSVQFWRLP